MTKSTPTHGRSALRNVVRSRLIDFMSASTDDEEERALDALMNIDDLMNHHDRTRVVDEDES